MALKQYDYDAHAHLYDLLELSGAGESKQMNRFLNRIFRRRRVSSVLDMTCGTGAQAIGLARYGYRVVGCDSSLGMLKEARKKARGMGIPFRRGNMRTSRFGAFDAVVSIFNAVGHLTPEQFGKAMWNIRANLKPRGIYVFDIFNLEFMRSGGFRAYEFIDLAMEVNGTTYVRFDDNRLDRRSGVMRVNQRTYVQDGVAKPRVVRDTWDLQMYTAEQLERLLRENGFPRVRFYGGRGQQFDRKGSMSILAVAGTR